VCHGVGEEYLHENERLITIKVPACLRVWVRRLPVRCLPIGLRRGGRCDQPFPCLMLIGISIVREIPEGANEIMVAIELGGVCWRAVETINRTIL
jgi:hypothetical protein